MRAHDLDDFPALVQARAHWNAGATDAALDAFATAVAERPNNIKALLEAARAYGGRHEIARAEEFLDQSRCLAGNVPQVAVQIAVSYGRIYREHRAIALLEAIPNRPPGAMAELAALYEKANLLEAAAAEIGACIAAAPGAPEPRLALARILRRRGERARALGILKDLVSQQGPPAFRAEVWTELCYIHDREGDAEAAAAAISEAHGIILALPQTADLLAQSRRNNRVIATLAETFRSETLGAWQNDKRPGTPAKAAHLIGFPRSGTTLLEQCLDAHPGLVASPERVIFTRDILPRLCAAGRGGLTIGTLNRVPADALHRERQRYSGYMAAALGSPVGDRLHLDKNPNHTGLLPALLRLHPDAKLVVALRDPRDVVTSCVLRSFRPTEFSAMLLDWGTAAELYAAEMGAWLRYRSEIDAVSWTETRYEDMVTDPMGEVQRILPTLGLGWDPAIATYRDRLKGKIVNSPTQTEVRQPIHDRAVGRWKAYRRHLDPHMHRLAPFIAAFGYD